MNSWKCFSCGRWIYPMEIHEDCARKQDEKRDRAEVDIRIGRWAEMIAAQNRELLSDWDSGRKT